MNWQTPLLLAGVILAVTLVTLRVELRLRGWVALVLILPTGVLIFRWAAYRKTWLELALGIGLALGALALWWWTIGRKLPPPSEADIQVLTDQDDGG